MSLLEIYLFNLNSGVFGSFQSLIFLIVLEFTISLNRPRISIEPEEPESSSSSHISINTNNCDSFNTEIIQETEPGNTLVITSFNDFDSPPKYDSPEKCPDKTIPDYEPPPSYDLSTFK